MRIAQIAPLTEAVPPKLYGGTERVIAWLTEELVALGHDVTLFASGDSHTSARLEAIWPRALRLDTSVRDPMGLHMAMLEQVRRQSDQFDVLHFHLDYYPFSLFSRQTTPFITTLHGRLDLPEHQPVFTTFSSMPVISISNSQRRPVPQAGWVKTIYHGLPADLLTPSPCDPVISHSWAAYRRRNRSIAQSGSPSGVAFRSRSRPRSTGLTGTISRSRSAR